MKRLTDAGYWEEQWWKGARPRRLWLFRDFDFETVRLLGQAIHVARRGSERAPVRVLELGAGGSRVLPYLARRFSCRVFGTDFSFAGCRLLAANLSLQKVDGRIVCEDMFESSISASTFDVVYSSGLVEHFDDTRAALAEHLRVLRPGGQLVIIVPNFQGIQGCIWHRLAPPIWRLHRVFGPADLAGYFRDLGFKGVCSGYLGSFFVHVGCGEEWTQVARWPGPIRALGHYSVRLTSGLMSLFFRWSPLRPHTKTFSPAFFAVGTKPQSEV